MNVLHINGSDTSGGAAIAGYRLHQGLLTQKVDSRLLVHKICSPSKLVATVPPHKLEIRTIITHPLVRLGLNYINQFNTFEIPKHPFYQNADVLNFHNLHGGFFNYLAIPSLTQNKPAIFTLHDMWSFTGHCTYSYECDRWKIGCGKCPYPNEYPEIKIDNTYIEWKLKRWAYKRSQMAVVAPSLWLAKQAKQSILNCLPIHHIPYGIDTTLYEPLDSEQCRSFLGIPLNKKVLLFAAHSVTEPRKGWDLLLQALQRLPQSLKTEIVLLTFGSGGEKLSEELGMQSVSLGYVSSDRIKCMAYSAADLFIFPTRADNLPLVLQESMSCGAPMVSFKIGGVPDLVRPGITGYLALPEDAEDFSSGIVQLLEDQPLREQMRQNCRAIALKEYSLELQAQRYIELYHQISQK